jgi:Na+-driven multidrug efflux pump
LVAIVVAKQMFGGLGHNFVNPAIAARIVLFISFPVFMTKFPEPFQISAVTSATPLSDSAVEGAMYSLKELVFGTHGGTIGETSVICLGIGALYLILRGVINPIIPVSFIGSVALLTLAFGGNPLYAICSGGLIFTAGYNMVSAVLRGMGDAKSPFLFIGIATVINIGLDLLFTGYFGWGVVGVACATVIAQACSFIFSLVYLYIRREGFGFDFKLRSFRPEKRYVGMITSLGTPMAIQSGFINVSMLFVSSMINGISAGAADTYGATFGTGLKIDDMINKVSQGIQYAAMPMISQNIGAGDQKRAKDVVYKAWIVTGVLTVFCVLGYAIFGKYLFMLFSDDAVVLDLSGTFIKAILWMFPAFAIMRGTGAFIQGIGNAKLGMVLAMLDGVVLRIGLSWLFGIVLDMGFFGFVLGYALAPYGYAIPSFIYFMLGRWKKKKTLADRM